MDLMISKKLKKDVIYINIQLNFRLRVKIWDLFCFECDFYYEKL